MDALEIMDDPFEGRASMLKRSSSWTGASAQASGEAAAAILLQAIVGAAEPTLRGKRGGEWQAVSNVLARSG
jgi:hypothetical protein